MIGWNEPKFGKKELELVKEVLNEGYVSEGPKTKELEKKLAKIVGVKHVIMTTSGTSALKLSLEAVKYRHWKEDFSASIPSLTFLATKNAVIDADIKPIIKDVTKDNYTIDSHSGNIFIPVNLLGRSAGKEFIEGLQEEGFPVICDNAGCLGSNVPIGDIGCYSLQGNKIISCGQGGFCATDSDTYNRLIRRFKDFGRTSKEGIDGESLNYKFNDILAAVTLGQLELLDERRQLLVDQYLLYKKEIRYGKFMEFTEYEVPLWVEMKCSSNYDRDKIIERLKRENINCRIPWKPLDDSPNANEYYKKVIWLPNGPTLTKDKQMEVIKQINKYYGI